MAKDKDGQWRGKYGWWQNSRTWPQSRRSWPAWDEIGRLQKQIDAMGKGASPAKGDGQQGSSVAAPPASPLLSSVPCSPTSPFAPSPATPEVPVDREDVQAKIAALHAARRAFAAAGLDAQAEQAVKDIDGLQSRLEQSAPIATRLEAAQKKVRALTDRVQRNSTYVNSAQESLQAAQQKLAEARAHEEEHQRAMLRHTGAEQGGASAQSSLCF